MKRPLITLMLLAAFALIFGWNAVLLAPRESEANDVREEVAAAKAEEQALRASLAELRRLAGDSEAREDQLARFTRLIPPEPDLAGFIRTMNDVATSSQVDWSSLTPAAPTTGVGGAPATVGLSIKVDGTFFQLLDYLRRIENLERLVVIDAVDMAAVPATGGPSKLTLNLQGRTFASFLPAGAASASPSGSAGSFPGAGPPGASVPAEDG